MNTILFTGDSITDSDRREDTLGLGYGYVDIVARTLRTRGDQSTVVNTGVAGSRVAHLRQRWSDDVLAQPPDVLSVYIGVNDTLAAFFDGRPTPTAQFEDDYTFILDSAVAAGVSRLVLVEPFFVDSAIPSVRWGAGTEFIHEDLAAKQAVVAMLATRYRATFVPLQSPVDALAASRGPTMVAADGVHPTPLGCDLIASAWLTAYAS